MVFLDQRCGAWQNGTDADEGSVTFTVFYPAGADPHAVSITVVGDFQSSLGGVDWDPATGLAMAPRSGTTSYGGMLWSATTPQPLGSGYHEYAYVVTFDDDDETTRQVGDPCARYGGRQPQTAGVVVGGSHGNQVQALASRRPWRDLIVYELMIDDFSASYRGGFAPVDAVTERLDELVALGINAIEFMPWTAWRDRRFDWGYEPCQLFAVETRYTRDESDESEHLSRLKNLISACHAKGLQVIMDGVFNHVSYEFPYALLYLRPQDCPLVGAFGEEFAGLQDLDFHHPITAAFIVEACVYWIAEFGIDGLRFDAAPHLVDTRAPLAGLPEILAGIRGYVDREGLVAFTLILEYLKPDAVDAVERFDADGYWDEALWQAVNVAFTDQSVRVRPSLLAALTPRTGLSPGRVQCAYLSNHDHPQVLWRVGAKMPNGAVDNWWRVQPYLIALFTGTGVPLIPNGQEVGEEHFVPEHDGATRRRILSRPVRWSMADDVIGRTLVALHARLARLRTDHPALRSAEMTPSRWEDWQTQFDPASGLGFDAARQLVLYRRSAVADGGTARDEIIVVINFANDDQEVAVPFPGVGTWMDVLSGFAGGDAFTVEVTGDSARVMVGGNWGRIFAR